MSKPILEYQRCGARVVTAASQWVGEHWLGLAFSVGCAVLVVQVLVSLLLPAGWTVTGIILRSIAWVPLAALFFGGLVLTDWLFERLIENNYKTLLVGRYLRRRRIAW